MHALTDGYGRVHTYLRIAVTERCNLRCRYCMPNGEVARLAPDTLLSFPEISRIAGLCAAMGIRKMRLTGGEPTMRTGVETLVGQLVALPGVETVAMTTNGVHLATLAPRLKAHGLARVNISLDSLRPERFARIAGRDYFPRALAGIEAALAAGFTPLKLNVVMMGGINDDELVDYVEFVRDRPINVRFIEYMPFRGNGWNRAAFISAAEMLELLGRRYTIAPVTRADDPGGVARDYRVAGVQGLVSMITPLSAAFCDRCSRLRLTPDGCLQSCLFSPAEVDLRTALREGATDDDLVRLIRTAVALKPAAHAEIPELLTRESRQMSLIGG